MNLKWVHRWLPMLAQHAGEVLAGVLGRASDSRAPLAEIARAVG